MAIVKPFKAIRPAKEYASQIAALPYDVYSSKEARAKVHGDKYSFLRIDRAETQFEEEIAVDDPRVYEKARQILDNMIENGDFINLTVVENKSIVVKHALAQLVRAVFQG